MTTEFRFQEAAADFYTALLFFDLDPVLDLGFGPRCADEFQPVFVRRLSGRRENFDRVAAFDLMLQRNYLAIHLRPDTVVADLRMDGVRKIDWRRAARKFLHDDFGGEHEDHVMEEVQFHR